jgi:hypothetical protein
VKANNNTIHLSSLNNAYKYTQTAVTSYSMYV